MFGYAHVSLTRFDELGLDAETFAKQHNYFFTAGRITHTFERERAKVTWGNIQAKPKRKR